MSIEIFIPNLRLVSEANSREHWAVKSKRRNQQASLLSASVAKTCPEIYTLRGHALQIQLTRIAPRALDPHDNLPASFKYLLDALCDLILPGYKPGRADGRLNLAITYSQEKGEPKQYAVKILINHNQKN